MVQGLDAILLAARQGWLDRLRHHTLDRMRGPTLTQNDSLNNRYAVPLEHVHSRYRRYHQSHKACYSADNVDHQPESQGEVLAHSQPDSMEYSTGPAADYSAVPTVAVPAA